MKLGVRMKNYLYDTTEMLHIYLLVLTLYANFAPNFFMLIQLAWKSSKINIALISIIYKYNPLTLYINASTVSQGTSVVESQVFRHFDSFSHCLGKLFSDI